MLEFKKLEVALEKHETVWISDPAVDLEQTDVEAWGKDGTGYVLKPKVEPSLIKWRALTRREGRVLFSRTQIDPDVNSVDAFSSVLLIEYARFGLISIKGIRFKRKDFEGVRGLSDQTIEELAQFQVTPEAIKAGAREHLWLLDWVGGLIANQSFRDE